MLHVGGKDSKRIYVKLKVKLISLLNKVKSMLTIYSMPGCGYCDELKDYLKENNIPYTEIDCAKDQNKAHAIIEKTKQLSVPITVIHEGTDDEKFLIGFQKDAFAQFLTDYYKK